MKKQETWLKNSRKSERKVSRRLIREKMIIQNPVLRGFYPDPSVCSANGKYYMVCSSFQFFPGVPLFESDDLLNWHQIGHCLTRSSQIDLENVGSSGGVFAPTIRYNDGVFYMVTTNDTYHKNFYVTTKDIYGEWSEPVFVDQGGIDPSLYFEDGKTYFMSNGSDEDGNGCIFQCEINPVTGERLTESVPLWKGNGGRYLESPHLYKFGDWYYIMAAEGGTEYGHMITYARGRSVYGPFENYEKNPVLTNRNLGGHQSVIQGIGHGDLIQDKDGNTFIFCLGFRQQDMWMPFHQLGREVFMAPVQWDENGWFTAGKNGIVCDRMEIADIGEQKMTDYSVSFETLKNNPERFISLRKPDASNYDFDGSVLRLKGTGTSIMEPLSPTFLGVRQSEFFTELKVKTDCRGGEAGISFYMDQMNHYDFAVVSNEGGKKAILRISQGDLSCVVKEVMLKDYEKGRFRVETDNYFYKFILETENGDVFMGQAQDKYLSSEVCSGFTGVVMGFYAQNNGYGEFTDFYWKQGK